MPTKDDLELLRRVVLDHPLTQVGDAPLQTNMTAPLRVGALTLTPTAQLSVRVLNRAEDEDEDAVFGDEAHIAFDRQQAWVKYKLAAKASGRLGFGIATGSTSSNVELSDYRIHAATDGAWNAISADLASPRTLLSLDDVRSLAPGEALAMDLGGALSASVRFSWSDVIAAKLGEIVDGFTRVPVAVKLPAGLDVVATAKVTDQFSMVVSRTREGLFRIAVKKAKSRDHAFSIDVSFGAEASAVPGIDDALDAIFDALGAEGAREVAAAAELRKTVRARLVKFARWKATAGFAYEYARIDESTAIADFILHDQARLPSDYARAISGDFAKIAELLRQDTRSRTLVRYLNETTVTRKSSSGFSLGPISTKDTSVFKLTTRTSLDGFQLVTARGTRRYDEKRIPQNDFEWTVDLKAQMSEFVAAPTTLDFDYGLSVVMLLERNALREDDLERMLDLARMWDVCPPEEALLHEALGKKGSIRVQLMLERDALIATLGAVRETIDHWAEPLAAAMPYTSTLPERQTFALRREVYGGAFRAWLRGDAIPRIGGAAGLLEQRPVPGSFAWTIGDGHPQLRSRVESFVRGARALHSAMTSAHAPETIGEAYEALQQLWSQRLYIAACGRYLLDRAPGANVTMQIEFADGTITM